MKFRARDGSGSREYRYPLSYMEPTGTTRLYFRRGSEPKIRLYQQPGTAAFDAEYLRVYAGEPAPRRTPGRERRRAYQRAAAGTLRYVVEQYYKSPAFAGLADTTRKVRRGTLESICATLRGDPPVRIGTLPFAEMPATAIRKLRDEKAAQPDGANARVKALRQLFTWALEYGFAEANPAKDVAYLKPNNPDGFRAWTEAEAAQYEARHPLGTKARLAFDLLTYTGVRRSDVVKLGPQMEQEGMLCFTETKGARHRVKRHALPILPPLRASIDAAAAAGAGGHLVYLVTRAGKAHSDKAFGAWFKRRCEEAGLDAGLAAHGLRKLAAVRCAEAGASEHELMALFGWTKIEQAAAYTRRANRAKLEAGAAHKLQRAGATSPAPPEHALNKSDPDFTLGPEARVN
jgi:site-specific recombinase XerD